MYTGPVAECLEDLEECLQMKMRREPSGFIGNALQNRVGHTTTVERADGLFVHVFEIIVIEDVKVLIMNSNSRTNEGKTRRIARDRSVGKIELDSSVFHGDDGNEPSHESQFKEQRVGNDAQIRHSGIVAQTSTGNIKELISRHVFWTDTHSTPNGSTQIRRIYIGARLIDLHTEGSECVQASKLLGRLVGKRVLGNHTATALSLSQSEYREHYLCICFEEIPAIPHDEPPRPYSRIIPTTYGLLLRN